jgi:nitrite reductase/ring-hydroxylating ferredoxin subunit
VTGALEPNDADPGDGSGGAAAGPPAPFVRAAREDEVPDGTGLKVRVGSRDVALFRTGGAIHAIDDRCAHQYASLAEGFLCGERGEVVVCPLHGWRFDVTTGGPPGGVHHVPRVDRLDVRVVGGVVYVDPTPRRAPRPPPPLE